MIENGKVALVAGASGGIGYAVARRLASDGYRLYLTAHQNQVALMELCKGLPDAKPVALDITQAGQVQDLCNRIYSEQKRIDVLVNCIGSVRELPALAMEDEDWRSVMEVNLDGAFRLCRCAAKLMVLARRGRIVNISSVAARLAGRGQINYAAAKAGVEALTRVLAIELGRYNILVNAVAPGCIETALTERVRREHADHILAQISLKRFGTAAEVAEVIAFLLSDNCSYISGQVLAVDGGFGL